MAGFFNSSTVVTGGCGSSCKLSRTANTPRMVVGGRGRLRVMVIGDAPGEQEDAQGTQWVGRSGDLLKDRLRRLGVDLEQDCWKANALACRPPGNGEPLPAQIQACRPRLLEQIRELKPSVVLLLGMGAVESVVGARWNDSWEGINRWRGWTIPDPSLNCWLCPTWHPREILKGQENTVMDLIWQQDLEHALGMLDKPLPADPPSLDEVKTDPADFLDALDEWMGWEVDHVAPVAFDYETSGLKPDAPGHFIHTVAASDGDRTVAALLSDVKQEWCDFLTSTCPKAAHNAKFEERWSRACLGLRVNNWAWDTMMSAHVEDNRPDITSLAFQAFVHLGVVWKDDMKKFLHGRDETNNNFNQVRQAPIQPLLTYNGMDALVTAMLAGAQRGRAK